MTTGGFEVFYNPGHSKRQEATCVTEQINRTRVRHPLPRGERETYPVDPKGSREGAERRRKVFSTETHRNRDEDRIK